MYYCDIFNMFFHLCILSRYLKRADGVMLVYDITQNKYFMGFRWKIENLRARNCPDAVFMLVGNKCDLADRREVPEALGRKYAGKARHAHLF